jgi:hypothetical protein
VRDESDPRMSTPGNKNHRQAARNIPTQHLPQHPKEDEYEKENYA